MKRLESVAVGGPLDGVKLDGDMFWDGRIEAQPGGRYLWSGSGWVWSGSFVAELIHRCRTCGETLTSPRRVFCSNKCKHKGRRKAGEHRG